MLAQNLISGLCIALMLVSPAAAAQDSRLPDAAMRGDNATVQTLLAERIDVNAAQGDGTTALHWAAYRDDLLMVRMLIKAGANLEIKTRLNAITPLLMASENGSAEMIALLLDAGADPNSPKATGTTPLMLAAASGSRDTVEVLLEHGARVDARESSYGQTALIYASALGRAAVIKLLVDHGADVNAITVLADIHGVKSGYQNAPRSNRSRPTSMGGNTALHFAAREGHIDAVRELVVGGIDVNQVALSDDMTAISQAILNGHFDIAKFLLDHGADVTLASSGGLTPLYATIDARWASRTWYPPPSVEQERTDYLDLIKELIAAGADTNARMGPKMWMRSFHGGGPDTSGATPFWRAAEANDVSTMRLLVAAGADPQTPTLDGVSPLQVAAGFGHSHQAAHIVPDARMATIEYLVDILDADVNFRDGKGYTPLHGAALVGRNDIIMFLVERGADVKVRSNMVNGRADDTDVDVADGTGDTIADYANGPSMNSTVYPDTVSLLIRLGSEFSTNCRSSTCVNPTRPDRNNNNHQ